MSFQMTSGHRESKRRDRLALSSVVTLDRIQTTSLGTNIGSEPKMSRFQWILNPGQEVVIPDHDLPLFVSDLFVVMPTLGCLVPGWLLIVPRRAMANLTNLNISERKSLRKLIAAVRPRLNHPGKQIFYFEHGSLPGSPASCGIDQAHLHIAPLPFDLVEVAIQQTGVAWEPTSCHAYSLSVAHGEYLFVADSSGRAMIGTVTSPTSQWFRKLIAAETNQHDLWDYRTHFGLSKLAETAQLVGQLHDDNA